MDYKKRNFLNAPQYIMDIKRNTRYEKARKFVDADVMGMDKTTLSELTALLRNLISMAGQLSLIQGVNITKTIQQQLEKLPQLIQHMISIWGIEEFIRRCEHAVKIDAYRPKNMPILDLVAEPDLFCINGPFSTFDKKLGKKQIANKTVDQIKEYINKNIPTANICANTIANTALSVLNKNADQQKHLIFDGDILTYNLHFQKIANDMLKELNLPSDAPWVYFVESWDFLPNAPEGLMGISSKIKKTADGAPETCIIININNIRKKTSVLSDEFLQKLVTFCEAAATFTHEFVHFIDREHPNHGALGAQQSHICNKIYDSKESEYKKNPCEMVPLMTGDIVKQELIRNALKIR